MLTLLADVLMTATGQSRRHDRYPDRHDDHPWADRFVPQHRQPPSHDPYRFNPYRDLW
ncbi:hypothetical protein R5H30_08925 [Sulfitobacter sp. D35]|uniref:hypothetical protein n=1 Tax=Sulfitobacter sp. D35 TaxID=3083252 RepID=UPI00296EFA97|nr:hypothetical protein [Sulfitobacter sp. D35]MDW4498099.1 hypothetical protein [Sulfitobacter sp. D35]